MEHIIIITIFGLLQYTQGVEGKNYQGDKLCMCGSTISPYLSDPIKFEYVHTRSNPTGPVYLSNVNNQDLYLTPYFQGFQSFWVIQTSDGSKTYSYCAATSTDPFDPIDCISNWYSYNANNEAVKDNNMKLVDCNDICVSEHRYDWINGTYVWSQFDNTQNGSIYECIDCIRNPSIGTMYLYAYIVNKSSGDMYAWFLHDELGNNMCWSYCITFYDAESNTFDRDYCLSDGGGQWLTSVWKDETKTETMWVDSIATVEECSIITTTTVPTTTTAPATTISSSITTITKTSPDSSVKSEIQIEGVLLFVVVIFLVIDVILIGICLYYIGTNLRRRIMQPHNVPWLQAIKQFQLFHFISIALELYDIITDYVFSVGLILQDPDDMALLTLGWIALIVSVIGLILCFIKYMVIRKLYGKQIASLRESLKRTADEKQRDSVMEQIRSRIMDVDMLSLLNACVEDIPQIVIVLIVFTNFGIDAASILCITGSILSFGMKVAGIIMGKCGCKDVTEEFDPTLQTQPSENIVLTEQSEIATGIGPEGPGSKPMTNNYLFTQQQSEMQPMQPMQPTVIYSNRVQQPVQPIYGTHYM